jgi:hypothetical protein
MTTLNRTYAEMEYVFEPEVATITVGLSQMDQSERAVALFKTDGGLVAAVSIETTESCPISEALDMAIDLAFDEIDRHLPEDATIPDPWNIRLVDHDGMGEYFSKTRFPAPEVAPTEPVRRDGDEGGVLAVVGE